MGLQVSIQGASRSLGRQAAGKARRSGWIRVVARDVVK